MKAKTKIFLKNKCPRPLWRALVSCYRKIRYLTCRLDSVIFPKKMKYYCPCCGISLPAFEKGDYEALGDFYDLSLFKGIRQDILCPACGSLPRHRILATWCSANTGLLKSKDILYFAPERGMTTWMKHNRIAYKTADLYDTTCDLKLDIQDTGLGEDSLDLIICNHVLEHVLDYKKALTEMSRILRPGGILICSFPVASDVDTVYEDPTADTEEKRLRLFGQSDHVRLFGINSHKLIEEAGFEVSMIEGADCPDEIVPVTGPCAYDINRLYVCKNHE